MRPSSRSALVDAAKAIIVESGLGALTFESLAARSGISRGGVNYHFPQREALVRAVCESFIADFEADLQVRLGAPHDQSTVLDRARAYLEASARPRGIYLYGFVTDPEVRALDPNPWDAALGRWAAPPPADDATSDEEDAFVLRVLAHGISAYRALVGQDMGEPARDLLLRKMARAFHP